MKKLSLASALMLCLSTAPAFADFEFSRAWPPFAYSQSHNMSIELHCDRIRFSPAGYEDSQDIIRKGEVGLHFMKNATTESGAFMIGEINSTMRIVDNYPVEIRLLDRDSYDFILNQLAANATLNISMVEQEISYGLFSLKGSARAIRSLRSACR